MEKDQSKEYNESQKGFYVAVVMQGMEICKWL